ncbi:MAG TPA: sulfite exporter TauE/SafE family protein [Acidimicrobiales bacterium]|jgi:uncharacterized protein|nr:sulfite exporter TauE/SafE family protein [Acidimicrobiales bacterium]
MTGRLLLASPLGFLIGVSLGALGGGGSILAVPVLVFVAGQTFSEATTTSLLVVAAAAVVGAVGHWRHGRARVGSGALFGVLGIGGSLAGSTLNRRLDGDVLLLAFAGLIVVAAWRIVAGCPSCTRVGETTALRTPVSDVVAVRAHRDPKRVAKLAAAGTVVGFLTGLFGVGGGFVIVPALTLVLQYSMPEAIGTSLVVIAVNTATAFAARLGSSIDWGTTLAFAVAAVGGVGAGTRIAGRIEPQTMQRSFAALLVVVALYTGGRAATGVW